MTPRSRDPRLAAAVLDALPAATLVVDARLRVVHANAAARAALGAGAAAGASLGGALGCAGEAPASCARCAGCAIRAAARRALSGERARARGFLARRGGRGEPADLHLLVSAAPLPGGVRRAVLVLDDADAILLDPAVLRVCCGCGRVADDGRWLPLHRWLEDCAGAEAEALCDACARGSRASPA